MLANNLDPQGMGTLKSGSLNWVGRSGKAAEQVGILRVEGGPKEPGAWSWLCFGSLLVQGMRPGEWT